jgi:hypothetical protein
MLDLLPEVQVCKVSRVSNIVAHDLAQLGKSECGVLHENVPSCVMGSLMRDCKTLVA